MNKPVDSMDRDSDLPLYKQVYALLKGKIHKGEYLPDTPVPAERELTRIYKISRNTALQALRTLADEGLIYRIPGSGTFVSTRHRPRNNLLGIIVPCVTNPLYSTLVKAVEEVAHARKFTVILSNAANSFSRVEKYGNSLIARGVDGVVFVPQETDLEEEYSKNLTVVEKLYATGISVVFLDRHLNIDISEENDFPWDSVTSDNERGGYLMTRYLLGLGHHSIAFIRGAVNSSALERIRGYREALLRTGIEYREDLVLEAATEGDIPARVDDLLYLSRPPSAIFCQCDDIAKIVLQCLKLHHMDVPGEMSVAGFDDMDLAQHLSVPLTTVRQQVERMGAMAAKLLIDRIRGVDTPPQHIRLPVRLVERKSCDTPPVRGDLTTRVISH